MWGGCVNVIAMVVMVAQQIQKTVDNLPGNWVWLVGMAGMFGS